MNRRRFIAVAAAAVAAPGAVLATERRWRGTALGAEAAITLRGLDLRAADAALDETVAVLRRMEAAFSLYDPGSELSRLNRDGRLIRPGDDFEKLLAISDEVHRLTGGRFDPTVQPLWQALARGASDAEIEAAAGLTGWQKVVRASSAVRLRPGMALTLNGIAQGYATDRISEALAAHGFGETLVNIGEYRASGGPWRIGVADPGRGIVAVRSLEDRAIATSSPSALRLGRGGQATHILNPKGPLTPPIWSTVSVEAPEAALADGLSTGFCLMDADAINAALRAEPGRVRVIAVDHAGLRDHVT